MLNRIFGTHTFASKPKLVVCSKSGHFPSTTETDIVVAELKRFLDGVR
jgi:hypothetical protein